MKRYLVPMIVLVCTSFAALFLSCGGSDTHQLQSITLAPTTADAQEYPNGEVQFIATGQYNSEPSTVTPLPGASWGVSSQNAPTTQISIDTNGLAKCMPGAVGSFSVAAWIVTPKRGVYNCGTGVYGQPSCSIVGTATLVCP